ncbi:MAG TPA: carboxypeptidase-like regulatory domain-containing protein [Polyangiales bacterium]|nr:carboxypeptidase-like regulatory domain-containing protein [Polyangiales bacterium]
MERCVQAARLLVLLSLVWPLGVARADGIDALPGVHEVPFGVNDGSLVRARAGLGYGWTESVLDDDDAHHRLQLDAAGSVTPLDWLSATLRVLGRYDVHTGGSSTSDSGAITETHLGARLTAPLGSGLHAGGQLELWLPAGVNAGESISALGSDLQLLLSYAPDSSPWTLGLAVGLRMDRSGQAGGEAERYSAADRLALGASDSIWAVRQGLAVSYRAGRLEWLGEWAYRMYVDHPAESPMWIRAALRYHASPGVQLELLLGVSPSARPPLDEDSPLAVVEPRVWAGLAAGFHWAVSQPKAASTEQPVPAPVAKPAAPSKLAGQIIVQGGSGLAGATLTLKRGESSTELTTDAAGQFTFGELEPGSYHLTVSAPGFVPETRNIVLSPGETPVLDLALVRELPNGQIRGTVRRFNGRPIVATVTIPELDIVRKTRADGTFEVDVQPGDYSVAVSADGFRPQTRKAHVEMRGVTILIVELEPAR